MSVERAVERMRLPGVGGLFLGALALALLAVPANAAPHLGAVDASFGKDGRAMVPIRLRNQAVGYLSEHRLLNTAVATATMAGGRVIVGGERTVAALKSDGKIDRRFGNNGRVNLPLIGEGQTVIKDVAVNANGRILVLAAARFAKGGGLVIVARLSANGEFDSSFADHGLLVTDFGLPAPRPGGPTTPPDAPTDVLPVGLAVDSAGRLVIAGTMVAAIAPCRGAGEQPHRAAYLARLRSDGSLDASFGKAGVVLDGPNLRFDEQHSFMGGVAIHEGNIFYATDRNEGANCEGFGGGLLVRLNKAGGRVPGFGSAGVLSITPEGTRPREIAVDRWGRILVMRDATSEETTFGPRFEVMSRWKADGTLDASFGHGGEIAVKLPGEESEFDAFSVDARGRPLLAGRIAPPRTRSQEERSVTAPPKFVLMRLRVSGLADRSFGRKGRVVTGFGHGSRAAATDITIRGKRAIVAGPLLSAHIDPRNGFALVRYWLGR